MKIVKILMFMFFILMANQLKAISIFEDSNNKVDLIGDFNLAYFNHLKSEESSSYIKNNSYYSTLGVAFSNSTVNFLTTKLVFDLKINNKSYYSEQKDEDSYKVMEMNNFYIEFESEGDTTTKIGAFDSLVTAQTVLATNKESNIYLLDAGYSFTNNSAFFGDKNGSDFANKKVQGLGHTNTISNFTMSLEVSSPKNNLKPRSTIEEDVLSKEYSIGGAINYHGDVVGYSIGYVKVKNKIKEGETSPYLSESMIESDNFLSSFSLSGKNIYVAISGGYYQNQKLAGITHTGASALLSYKLTKLVPYVGYQFLYADNIQSSIKGDNDIYNVADRKNYSFEQSVIVIGLSFKVHDGLILGVEHNNDIRSESQVDSSLLNAVNQDVTSIYLKYSI